jgi:hypothetical protein
MRPIGRPDDVPVFHRVDMNVFDMPREIVFVADQVLPILPLPDAALAFGDAAGRTLFADGHGS